MHKIALLGVTPALLVAGSLFAEDAANPNAEEAKGIIKSFATQLQGELQAAIKEGGPVKAIAVCQERAPAIAADLSEQSGWSVGRTSLKTRNPQNAPDEWERGALEQFEARKAGGEALDKMAFAEVVETESGQSFRLMKAIPTGEVCLACHGTAITPEVIAALNKRYPNDEARGFTIGDIRGAFTLSKPMKN